MKALLETIRKYLGVNFVYAAAPPSSVATSLPALRDPLMAALKMLDVDAVERAVEVVRLHDADAGARLAEMAAGFDYAGMQAALDATPGD